MNVRKGKIQILHADIATIEEDAIVYSANESLLGGHEFSEKKPHINQVSFVCFSSENFDVYQSLL